MLKDIPIGIMQGRLSNKPGQELQSFPYGRWHDEFERAHKNEYELIEWLVDTYDNPIVTPEGRAEIKTISNRYGIRVRSLCAHVFMNGDLISDGADALFAKNYLSNLLEFANEVDIEFVILPVMDKMSLRKSQSKITLKRVLSQVLREQKTALLLESDLRGNDLKDFIEYVGSSQLGAIYDLGNANALGFDIEDDLSTLGPLVKEIHIKDRMSNNGSSKRLGDGSTPFETIAKILNKLSWRGPVVLETPIYNDWELEAIHNLKFTKNWISRI